MKDAADLIHALQDNLGWTELRLRENSCDLQDRLVLRLLRTCRHLAQLLAGAVAIARRDACLESPNMQEVELSELARSVERALSERVDGLESTQPLADLAVRLLYDPEATANAVSRILDEFVGTCPGDATWSVRVGLRGVNAAISIRRTPRGPIEELTNSNRAPILPPPRFDDTLEICTALLARQGAALDFEIDETGSSEVTIVWPASVSLDPERETTGTSVAQCETAPVSPDAPDQAKRSGTMPIQSDRFGIIDIEEQDVIHFPRGIIGFPDEHAFILVRTKSNAVGWLQSTASSGLALPVVSAHVLAPPYPDVDIERYAQAVGLGSSLEELAVVVVLNAQPGVPATVNLVAPIIVNVATRVGAQVILDGTRFTTREMFILPSAPETSAQPSGESAISAAE